jgi:hypothetical protein
VAVLRKLSVAFVFAPVFSLLSFTPAEATSFDHRPKILLHAQADATKNACGAVSIANCQDAVTEAATGVSGQFVYVLGARGNLSGILGMAFGISYQENCPGNALDLAGLDIFSWTLCATQEFSMSSPPWLEPYSGTIVVWSPESNCQTGDVAVAGYFYCSAYSNDVLQIIKRPVAGAAELANCSLSSIILNESDLGFLTFSSDGSSPGCNPCDRPCPGPLLPPPVADCIPAPPPPPPPPPPPIVTQASILLHVTSVTTKNTCSFGSIESCSTAVVKGRISTPDSGPFYLVHVLVNRGALPTVTGLQFGITYDNGLVNGRQNGSRIDIFDWTLCAALQFSTPSPAWPNPGSGTIITWDRFDQCQTGYTAVAGYFYLAAYSADILKITPRHLDNKAKLADCDAIEFLLAEANLGYAAFSENLSTEGCNPCFTSCTEAVPVVRTTWSGVKTLFHQ